MTLFDYILMALILSGAVYLLYRSLFKDKSYCAGCSEKGCLKRDVPFNEKKVRSKR